MEATCAKEVLELHRFFEEWFSGTRPDTDESLARCDAVLAADFQIVNPAGSLLARSELFERLRSVHGGYREHTFRVRIEGIDSRRVDDDMCVTTYLEWQDIDGEWTCRRSSALFRRKDGAPNGVEWVHVHETWVEQVDDGPQGAES